MPLLNNYEGLFRGDDYVRKILGWIYTHILDFHVAALRFFNRPVWRQVFKSAWKDYDVTFIAILDNIKQHGDLLDKMANALHMSQSQRDSEALNDFISRYTQDANELRTQIDEHKMKQDQIWQAMERAETERKRTRKLEVLHWVAAASMSDWHERFCKARQCCPGSGDWILESEHLKEWKDSDTPQNSVLWLHGIAGAGKTVLASRIVESCTDNSDFDTTYFYCREGHDITTTCIGILKGLIAQMVNHCDDLIPTCHDKMNTTSDLTLTTESTAKHLLELFCKTIPKQFIVIDGLDECEEKQRAIVLRTLTSIVKACDEISNCGKPRLLFISRKLGDIETSLAGASSLEIRDANRKDIEAFVRHKIEQVIGKFDLGEEPGLTDQLQELVLIYSSGMFLYAELVMNNLIDCYDRGTFEEEISSAVFPQGIEQAYNRVLYRLRTKNGRNWQKTRQLLGWIVSAKRPLKMHELRAVLSIELTHKRMEYGKNDLKVHITECCGSLVHMVGDNQVELVHHTAREFIVKNRHVNEYAVQCDMTVLCLQYLTFDCFYKDLEEEQVLEHIHHGFLSFQEYAVSKWFHHLQTLIEKCGQFLSENGGSEAQQNLLEALDEFMGLYQEGLFMRNTDEERWKRDAADDCKAYENLPLFEHLRDLWAHVRMQQQTQDMKERDKIGIPELLAAVERNRGAMEAMAKDQKSLSQLDKYYGRNHYKCPRLTCPYFYEGFETQQDREKHLRRHDRPFRCVVGDCDQKIFGFTSNTQLEKHIRNYHPETCDTSTFEFQFAALNQREIEETKFTCPVCNKNFTRNISLKGHLDSHNGLKPFACPECGKAFTRKNDMVRHQKIHARSHRGG